MFLNHLQMNKLLPARALKLLSVGTVGYVAASMGGNLISRHTHNEPPPGEILDTDWLILLCYLILIGWQVLEQSRDYWTKQDKHRRESMMLSGDNC